MKCGKRGGSCNTLPMPTNQLPSLVASASTRSYNLFACGQALANRSTSLVSTALSLVGASTSQMQVRLRKCTAARRAQAVRAAMLRHWIPTVFQQCSEHRLSPTRYASCRIRISAISPRIVPSVLACWLTPGLCICRGIMDAPVPAFIQESPARD